jgi:transposase
MSDAGVQGANGGEHRRRTWSADQKQRIIAESFAPGASVAEVARRYGLNSNMLFTWRRRERADVKDVGKTVNIVPVIFPRFRTTSTR